MRHVVRLLSQNAWSDKLGRSVAHAGRLSSFVLYSPAMEIKVIRSKRRVKTVSGRMEGEVFVVRAPAALGSAELDQLIQQLLQRQRRKERKGGLDDVALERRARQLNRQYFDGQLQWKSIRWSARQDKRAGSCTPARGTIRLSHRLATMPAFVRDYVLVHELAHLLEANHSARFWELVNRYPRTERARGFLMAAGLEPLDG